MTRDEVIAVARSWLGTRYRQKGRSRQSGLDCIGLIVVVGRHFEVPHEDRHDYADYPDQTRPLLAAFDKALEIAPPASPWLGSVGVFTDARLPCHCGIFSEAYGERHLIHAMLARRMVIEEPYAAAACRLIRRYQFPGLAN